MKPANAPDHMNITTDDGVQLAADHYRTSTEGEAQGTVLIRTPYGRTQYADQARAWERAGYDVVVQDVRGRYGSAGEWNPYKSEGTDGAATARHLAGGGLLRGSLILAGASYDAYCAIETARVLETAAATTPLAVVAMVPALGLFETARHPDGSPRLLDRIGWWHQHGFGTESRQPLHTAELDRRHRQAEELGMDWVSCGLFQDADYGPGSGAKWKRLWAAQPADFHALYAQLTTPLLMISGQRDFFVAEALDLARTWGCAAPGTLVETLWGPWGHGLANDLDAGTGAALREQGGLMARIKDFLATASGRVSADALPPAAMAPNSRPAVLRWEPGGQTHIWRWTPATTETLQHQLDTTENHDHNS